MLGKRKFGSVSVLASEGVVDSGVRADLSGSSLFKLSKRLFDIFFAVLVLPTFLLLCAFLLIANRWWNPGSLFFHQKRRGRNGQAFSIIKFRTMSSTGAGTRGANDPLDKARITPLGKLLRQTKLDELPQILNILQGTMSVVGPRPEVFEYAEEYRRLIPGYTMREMVKPGLTGYAQVKQGYTDSVEAVRKKTSLDVYYVQNMGWRIDAWIIMSTFRVVVDVANNK